MRDEHRRYILRADAFLAQEQRDVLRCHVHAELAPLTDTRHDQRLNFIHIAQAGVHQHYLPVVAAQYEEQEVRGHPFVPACHIEHLGTGH